MFRSKRDVDRYVAELEEKIPSVTERALKYFTVARLYFNIGESDLALKHLDKYCELRSSSAPSYKFRGQVLENLADKGPQEQAYVHKLAAVEAYKTSYELDLSQKELLIKICELMAHLPVRDIERTRYWVDQGEKLFPRNKVFGKLREKMRNDDNEEVNGNGQHSTDDSPSSQRDRDEEIEADNSILWSTSRLGGSFALNGSYRLEDALNSTPGKAPNSAAARRFPPRPSPERLANQIRSVEAAQDKMASAVVENSRALLETQEAILGELRKTREDMNRNLRENYEAVKDLRSEMNSIWRDVKEEMRRNASQKQEVVVVNKHVEDKPAAAAPTHKSLDMQDLQEALAQQAALIQMSNLSMAGMFAQANMRPPVPNMPVPPAALLPRPLGPALNNAWPAGATIPQHPIVQPSMIPNTPVNVAITTSEKIPTVTSITPTLAPVSIPIQHRMGGAKPAETTPPRTHNYQINLPNNPSPAASPFADKEGPAVPITTSSILASIPAPVFSAVSTTTTSASQKKTVTTTSTTSSQAASGFDKFKPKPGSWECGGCFLRQNADVIVCPACQTPKPGHEAEAKAKEEAAKPAVSFGSGGGFKFSFGGGEQQNTNSSPGFSFGNKPAAAVSTPTTTASSTPAKPSPFSGFSFGTKPAAESSPAPGGFSFSGVQPIAKQEEATEEAEEGHDDSANHDPHFEPIIPLPELVKVTTGEEEEEVKFKFRSKVFRFDKDTKEWKERGIGDLKILFHPEKLTYRILLRREQVHKIACNHYITTDMKLEPMAKSETALTWFAMDYSDDGEARMEKLAARFKLAETKDEFKKVFEAAQEALKSKPPTPKKAEKPLTTSEIDLSFEGQGLKLNSAEDAKAVVDKITATKFHTLTFSGNTVGIDAAGAIGKALESHSELKYVHWKDMFTGRMKTEIPPALKHLSKGMMAANVQLVELDLSDNALGPIGMEGIVDLLRSSACFTLRELKLNNTGCGVTGGKLLAKTLLECHKASGGKLALTTFVLGRSRQENEGAKALAEVFKLMGSLEEVVMPQNGIFFEGITALADAFSNNPNLRILNMNDNTFTEKGAKALADALPKMQKLEVLNLGDCLLKTEGARLISYALKLGHDNLREWHMDSNEIRLAGGFAIVEAIANKANIQKLVLDTNQFGAEGCGKIMKKLTDAKKRHVLEEIEDDEEPEDSEDEGQVTNEEEDQENAVQNLSSFSFTGTGTTKPATSIFGGSSPSKPPESIFGGLKTSTGTPTTNLFGGNATSNSASPSIFGGGATTTPKFGSSTPAASGSIFGGFGTNAGAGIFGSTSTTPSIFGGNKETTAPKTDPSAGVDLSASKNLPTFEALSSNTGGGFAFGQKSDNFSFAGAGASLFGGASKSPAKPNGDDNEGTAEDPEHDPHFEPIVPLPELINVTTGEEDEEVTFKHRAKVYRFDKDTKQWKERGVGDIKILHHAAKNTFRVLLRRDQVHKIACNHYINVDQKLEPMSSSETALTWFAMDFTDDPAGQVEKLAVKFKLAETKDEFKKAFESAQAKLKSGPAPQAADSSATASIIVERAKPAKNDDDDDDDDNDEDYEDEETAEDEDEQSEDSDNTMYERDCELYEDLSNYGGQKETHLGPAHLRIIYDEDVYGARIIAVKANNSSNGEVNEDEVYLCNHIIAMQTTLDVDEENHRCSWSGLDFSVDPPKYRKFVADFAKVEEDAQIDFVSVFQEGKELAEQSEILEQPISGGSLNPEEIYYGQGAEYDDDEA